MPDTLEGTGDEQLAQQAASDVLSPAHAVLTGLRQPIVLILLLMAFFTAIAGKPLDGFLLLVMAILLVWDAARTRMSSPSAEPAGYGGLGGASGATAVGPPGPATAVATSPARRRPRITRRMLAVAAAWLAAGLLYAGIVGSFSRYSWPATIAVVSIGCLMVAVGWQGPLRRRAALTGLALRRAWLWGIVLVAGGLWELSSLLQQPTLTTPSYSHPTISDLTFPLLTSHPGRSVALCVWLLLGWFLVGR